jgi:hypothetical protein
MWFNTNLPSTDGPKLTVRALALFARTKSKLFEAARPCNGRAKPRRICRLHPFAWHPNPPGLSHSCEFASPLQLGPVSILLLLHPMRRSKSSLDRELGFSGLKHFMTGSTLGHGSNPAHGAIEALAAAGYCAEAAYASFGAPLSPEDHGYRHAAAT